MYIIRTRQKNWIEHILRGSSLQREINGRKDGREERKRKAHGRWRTDTGNSRKRYNIEKNGVVHMGHLDLPGSRSPKEEEDINY